jgi:ABC-type multidrug transport system fused ATPase/permease subunit
LLKEVLGYTRVRLVGYGVGKVVCDVKESIFKKYANSDYQFFLDNKQGKLLYDLLNATGRLGNCLQFIPDIFTAIFMTVTIGVLLFSISFPVTVILMLLGVVYGALMHMMARRISYYLGAERVVVSTRANVIANEMIDGIKHIKVSGSFDFWLKNFSYSVRRFKDLVIRDYLWGSVPDRMIQLLPVVMLIAVSLFLYFQKDPADFLSKHFITLGVYIYAFYRLSPYLTSFGRLRMQIMGALPDVEVLYDDLTGETNHIKDGTIDLKEFRKAIRFENVTFTYKGKKEILEDASFYIEKGKTTAIVGSSGSGKTTLINLIVRLFDPDSGRITVDGIDLKEIRHSSLIGLVGMVSQDTFIFNGTIKENITFGLKDISDEQLVEAARLGNAHEFIAGFPDRYDTVVGDKGLKLSGGQRQRIAIARAILRNPEILILDEATSSLDYHSEVLVQQAINQVSQNRTVIVIAHRLSTIINADKIVVIDRHRIVEEGSHRELMKNSGVYRFLYESQDRIIPGNAEKEQKTP